MKALILSLFVMFGSGDVFAGPYVSGGADKLCRNATGTVELYVETGPSSYFAVEGKYHTLLFKKSRFNGTIYSSETKDGSVLLRRPMENGQYEVVFVTKDSVFRDTVQCE